VLLLTTQQLIFARPINLRARYFVFEFDYFATLWVPSYARRPPTR